MSESSESPTRSLAHSAAPSGSGFPPSPDVAKVAKSKYEVEDEEPSDEDDAEYALDEFGIFKRYSERLRDIRYREYESCDLSGKVEVDVVREQLSTMKSQSMAAFGQVKAGEGGAEEDGDGKKDGGHKRFTAHFELQRLAQRSLEAEKPCLYTSKEIEEKLASLKNLLETDPDLRIGEDLVLRGSQSSKVRHGLAKYYTAAMATKWGADPDDVKEITDKVRLLTYTEHMNEIYRKG